MEKQTFKQYLDSREQLLRAIQNTPITNEVYEVKKYCTLNVGETEDNAVLLKLKPKQQVIVEWLYADVNNPTPQSVRVVGAKEIDESNKHDVFWTGTKLSKWLLRHASRSSNV